MAVWGQCVGLEGLDLTLEQWDGVAGVWAGASVPGGLRREAVRAGQGKGAPL